MAVDPRLDWRSRNWLALLGLWTALVTWLILIGAAVAVGSEAASEDVLDVVVWVTLGFATAALILSVAGITMIRTHGETAVAVLALVLTLCLSFGSALFLFF